MNDILRVHKDVRAIAQLTVNYVLESSILLL